jgi:hypothetical protein
MSWSNITDAKKAANTSMLNCGELAPTQNNNIRLQLNCLLSTCSLYIRVSNRKDSSLELPLTPHCVRLLAVGIDAKDHILPLAWALVKVYGIRL